MDDEILEYNVPAGRGSGREPNGEAVDLGDAEVSVDDGSVIQHEELWVREEILTVFGVRQRCVSENLCQLTQVLETGLPYQYLSHEKSFPHTSRPNHPVVAPDSMRSARPDCAGPVASPP